MEFRSERKFTSRGPFYLFEDSSTELQSNVSILVLPQFPEQSFEFISLHKSFGSYQNQSGQNCIFFFSIITDCQLAI